MNTPQTSKDPLHGLTLETIVTAPVAGTVGEVCVAPKDEVRAGDLLIKIAPAVGGADHAPPHDPKNERSPA